jgi:glycosyltransferase involved in cell wall biosynthesis
MNSNKINVLILIDSHATKEIGGAGTFAPILFNELRNANNSKYNFFALFNYRLFSNADTILYKSNLSDKRFENKLKFYINKISSLKLLLFKLNRLRKKIILNRVCHKNNIQIIHAHDFMSASLLNTNAEYKIILTVHSKGSAFIESIQYKLPIYQNIIWKHTYTLIERKAIANADLITFPSYEAKQLLINDYHDYKELIDNNSVIIHTGIAPLKIEKSEQYNNILRNKKIKIVNVANHIPAKGLMNTFNILNILKSRNIEFDFQNFGMEGPETFKLTKYRKDNYLSKNVHLMGMVSHKFLIDQLSNADFFLTTPLVSVFDLVILECMSLGLPVIAYERGAFYEALGNNYPYLSNNNNILADYILILSNNNDKYSELSRFLRHRFYNNFSVSKMIKSYIDIYYSILNIPPPKLSGIH